MTGTDLVQRTPAQELAHRIRQDAVFQQELEAALPASVTVDRFIRIAHTAILTNPDVANLEHTSVLRAMLQCAADGLMPDGKEAAITPRKGKAAYVPMILGFRKKAAEHGWTLRTAVVYENDEFDHAVVDGEEVITHRPVRPGAERGELIAAYAIAKHRDGRKILTVLHPGDISKRRESSAYDAVWNAHPAAMWEKSAGRDVFGQLGLAEGDSAIQRMLNADELSHGEAANALYGPSSTEPLAALPAGAGAPATGVPIQQADGATQGTETRPDVAPSAPGPDFEDEPSMDDPAVATDDTAAADGDLVDAARQAAMVEFPAGQNVGKSIGEVFNAGDRGQQYLAWAIGKFEDKPQLRSALFAFCRVYLPDAYQAELARQEAQVAR